MDAVERLHERATRRPESIGRDDVETLVEHFEDPADAGTAARRAVEAVAAAAAVDPRVVVPAVGELVALLDAGESPVRDAALAALVEVSEEIPESVESATQRLAARLPEEDDDGRRARVALVLARVAGSSPEAVGRHAGVLVEALSEEDPAVRANVARAVRAVAGATPEAVEDATPALVACLSDPVAGTRIDAARGLSALADGSPDVVAPHVDALVDALDDDSPPVRAAVAKALASVALADPPAVDAHEPALVAHLDDVEPVGDAAVEALMGTAITDPERTVRRLADLVADGGDDERVRDNAERTLRGIAMRNPAPVVSDLGERFDHPSPEMRRTAVRVLSTIADHRPERVVPVLEGLVTRLDDRDPVAEVAAEAVASTATAAPESLADLAEDLADRADREGLMDRLAPALRAVAGAAPAALDRESVPVEALLTAEEADVRADACRILAALGDAEALPALRERAEDPDREVRVAAVEAMAALAEHSGVSLTEADRERIAAMDVPDEAGDDEDDYRG